VFTFGVGHDVNAPLLDRIAERSRAAATYVHPEEDVEVRVVDVARRLDGPVLAGARIETIDAGGAVVTDVVREIIPAMLPDFFRGDQLVLLGQYRGNGPLRFRLAGEYLGKPRVDRFEFGLDRATTKNAFVPRLWATRRIAFLVDEIRQAGGITAAQPRVAGRTPLDDPRLKELIDEIVRLSSEFGVLTEYTSFLATEGTNLADKVDLLATCGKQLDDRAVRERWGAGAVAQSINNDTRKKKAQVDYYNRYYDQKLDRVEVTNVQQVCDRSFFRRGATWIDGRLVGDGKGLAPDRVVEYGTEEYHRLLDELVAANRAGVLSFQGEILLRIGDRTVLVKNDLTKGAK
jgi:Ca-activated chloride channel family protein